LQLIKCDGKQVTTSAEVYHEMEPSSEDEEAEVDAAFERSQMQAIDSEVNDAVSGEIACGSRAKRVTKPRWLPAAKALKQQHTQSFLLHFVRDYPGQPVPEK